MPSTQALQDYINYLNEVFNKTITQSRLILWERSPRLYVTRYQNDFLPLELKPQGYLHFWQRASIQPGGKVKVEECSYIYSLSDNKDDEDKWIFRYDYSLKPEGNKPHAHLHVNACRDDCDLPHIHFPTARVSVEQIIAHLILDHKIEPQCSDWLGFLAESHKVWMDKRTDIKLFLFP